MKLTPRSGGEAPARAARGRPREDGHRRDPPHAASRRAPDPGHATCKRSVRSQWTPLHIFATCQLNSPRLVLRVEDASTTEPVNGRVSCVIERSSMQKKVWLSGAMAALGTAMLVAAAFAGPASSKPSGRLLPGTRRAGR